jgi:hypothetical protein
MLAALQPRVAAWYRRRRRFLQPNYPQALAQGWVVVLDQLPERRRDSRGQRVGSAAPPAPAVQWRLNEDTFSPQQLHWQWLAGLIDGDGYLSRRGQPRLVISGHRQEVALLRQAQRLLDHGTITAAAIGNGVRLAVNGRDALQRLATGAGPYLRHPRKRSRLRSLCLRFNWPLPPQQPLLANPGWVLGLLDADGSFDLRCYGLRQRCGADGSLERCFYYSPVLKVVNQQRGMLLALQRQFGGNIYPVKLTNRHRGPCWEWHLSERRSLLALVEHCRRLPSVGPKGYRLSLLPEFYALRDQGAQWPSSPQHRQ